jgi:hypothetical protein
MYSLTTKILIATLLVILVLILVFRRNFIKMFSKKEGFQAYTHERASAEQNQDMAKTLEKTNNMGAHLKTAIASTGNIEVSNMEGKQLHDDYSAKYSDCHKASLRNMPQGCVLCLDATNGNVLERTIVGPGNQSNNYFTPCPCPVKDMRFVNFIQKALACEKVKGPYGIIGTDCSYKFDGPEIGQGHGVLMDGDKPVLRMVNEYLNGECVIPFRDINEGARNEDGNVIILPASEASSRDKVAQWISANYPTCKEIDACMPELNENMDTMTQDCAQQIYFKYGKVGGSGDPTEQENYERIISKEIGLGKSPNIPQAYEELLRTKSQELTA